MAILDSGNRREFETGAVRDIAEDKGRCDLLPLREIADILVCPVLNCIADFMENGDKSFINDALVEFCKARYESQSEMFLEVSVHYSEGAKKYTERNWEKGIPCHCYIDSGVRHYLKWLRGDEDERHDRAFVWNMLGLLWTLKHRPEMNDLPFAVK